MRPNTKSKYFKISLACFAAYFVVLLIIRSYVLHAIQNGSYAALPANLLFWASVALVGLGSVFWYKTTKNKQDSKGYIMAFLLGPTILSPAIGFLYVLVVIMPIYSLVGSKLIK